MKTIKVGDLVTKTKLHKMYWFGAAYELEQLKFVHNTRWDDDTSERKKGEVTKYRILKELPEPESFRADVTKHFFTGAIEDWVQDALGTIEEVKDEMTDWRDNMEQSEGLSQTSKFEEVQSAADELEYIDTPRELEDLPEFLQEQEDDDGNVTREAFKVTLTPMLATVFSWRSRRNISGRSARLGDAGCMLQECAQALNEEADNEKSAWTEQEKETAKELANSMEELASSVEGIECPGMY